MQDGNDRVKVYGADWCGVTRSTLKHLDNLGVSYKYVDIDEDREAAAWVRDQNRGMELKPTLDIEGEVLSAPKNHILESVLESHGILK